jgi:hypothetical protein
MISLQPGINPYPKMEEITKPPLGLIPKRIHDKNVKIERYNDVCSAIARYYHARLKINIEWIEEYNDLVDYLNHLK